MHPCIWILKNIYIYAESCLNNKDKKKMSSVPDKKVFYGGCFTKDVNSTQDDWNSVGYLRTFPSTMESLY